MTSSATPMVEAAPVVARLHRREGLGPYIENLDARWDVGAGLFNLHAVKVAEADGTPVVTTPAPSTPVAEGIVERLKAGGDVPIPLDWNGRNEWLRANWAIRIEAASTIAALSAERDGLRKSIANPWCPDVCPITQRPFFMWIDGEPTYGGPFDSYTIPTRDAEGEFSCRRYDHDEGGWKDWTEGLSLRLVTEEHLIDIEDRATTAEAALATAQEALTNLLSAYEGVYNCVDSGGRRYRDDEAIDGERLARQALASLKGDSTP